MKVIINHQEQALKSACNVAEALVVYGLRETIFAVAVNGKVIPRSDYATLELQENDQLDILIPMQGG